MSTQKNMRMFNSERGSNSSEGAVSNPRTADLPMSTLPEISRSLAVEVLESCAVGDHTFLSLPWLRAARGFQQLVMSVFQGSRPTGHHAMPASEILLVAANPVAHGAKLVATLRKCVLSSTFSVVADARLGAEGLSIDHSFPGVSASSLASSVTATRLIFAIKLRSKLPRGSVLVGSRSRLYREYLFIAQSMRYAACKDAVAALLPTTVLVTDYDRHTYCRPWVWAANAAGISTVTLIHGSPNEANYIPVLAQYALVWGAVQKKWIEERSTGTQVFVVGRPDLENDRVVLPSRASRVVMCHSREELSLDESKSLLAQLVKFRNQGYLITLRLHPSATRNDLDARWRAVADLADDIVISRDSLVASLGRSDIVVCVLSSSAVEAIAVGVPAIVVADASRNLPSDLSAIRDASPDLLREIEAGPSSFSGLDYLASQILEATGDSAGVLLDQALSTIRSLENAP